MSERKMPKRGTLEAFDFLNLWDSSDHRGKLKLCELFGGVSYSRAKSVIGTLRASKLPPEVEDISLDVPWEDQIDIFKNMDRLIGLHLYTPTEITIPIETDKPVAVAYFADWQLGQYGVDYENFKVDIKTVRDEPGLYCEVGGDGYQNIIQPSKVGSSHNQQPIAPQRGLFVLTLKELGCKIKVLRTGNHNYWSTLAVGEDWERELARRMKLLYMKHYGKVYWKVGEMVYPEVSMHKGRFNSSFNLTHSNKQHQRLDFPDARITVIEDKHMADMEQYRYNERECVAIRTGTYAVYDDYAQQNGFFGAHVCNPAVVMFPGDDRLVGFKDMHDAIIFLRAVRQ